MKEKELRSIIRKLEITAFNKKRTCLHPMCTESSIQSHLLQKKGILKNIAFENHLYKLGVNPLRTHSFFFEKIGINEAFTFPGFCNTHDTSAFKEIETKEIDFSKYRVNLLFSYRILANELRKKEILIDWHKSLINNFILNQYFDNSYFSNLRSHIKGCKLALQDINYFLQKFYIDMFNNKESFSFYSFELPFVEVCASGVFTYETTNEMRQIPDWLSDKPPTDIYFNLLPLEGKSIVIFGCLTEHKDKCWEYILSFNDQDYKKSLKRVGDLLLTKVENWLCSYSVYTKLKEYEEEISRITYESIESLDERRDLSFNLFSYLENQE